MSCMSFSSITLTCPADPVDAEGSSRKVTVSVIFAGDSSKHRIAN